MNTTSKSTNIVEVRVTDSRASGLYVNILKSGKSGFIPRREITWERRVSVPFVTPKIGEVTKALILEDHNKLIMLSMKQVHDPWLSVTGERKYKHGQLVTGEIVNVRHFGAYAQLEPGVDAVIHPREASFLSMQKVEEVLWVGDRVEAEIINLDLNNRLIELSPTKAQRSRAIYMTVEQQARELLARFGAEANLPHINGEGFKGLFGASASRKHALSHVIRKLSSILIVDDDPQWRERIHADLVQRFRVSIDEAANGAESLGKLAQGMYYDLMLIDINLKTEDGTELAQTIRETNPDLPIILMSTAPLQSLLNQYPGSLIEDEFVFAQKDDEGHAIAEKIIAMRTGLTQTSKLSLAEENTWIQNLGLQAFADQPISVIFDEILKWLHSEIGVSFCLVVRLDEVLRGISITASYPPLSANQLHIAQDGLYYSPARQILEENLILSDSTIDFDDKKYKNFFHELDFHSYLGVPIRTPGQNTATYGLILLDQSPESFSKSDPSARSKLTSAQLATYFLAITLERASTFDYMRRYESQYSLGQLTSDLIHETSNKLNALDASVKTIEAHWERRPDSASPQAVGTWLDKVGQPIQAITAVNRELKEIFDAYSQQARAEYTEIDVNKIVENVLRQLFRTATQKGVRLYEKKSRDLPALQGYQTGLKQVVLNLVLNAIQMFDLHQKWLQKIGKDSTRPVSLADSGMVIVQTKYIADDTDFPVEIRVIDNGPGVHYHNWERIFSPGYSGRGGSGLGLYISRNLIQRMGGKLFLLDSILFSGSVFVIRLPMADKEKQNGKY